MATSKRFKKAAEGLEPSKSYTVEEAVKLVKARATAKFDETIELSLNLGVDPRHSDQQVRSTVLLTTPAGKTVRVLDLPGAYSLSALSADEAVAEHVVTGQRAGEAAPDLLVCVVDATKLQLGLRMVLEARAMGLPMVVPMNMSDAARRRYTQHPTWQQSMAGAAAWLAALPAIHQ